MKNSLFFLFLLRFIGYGLHAQQAAIYEENLVPNLVIPDAFVSF